MVFCYLDVWCLNFMFCVGFRYSYVNICRDSYYLGL